MLTLALAEQGKLTLQVMMLTGAESIRDVILFPLMKPADAAPAPAPGGPAPH